MQFSFSRRAHSSEHIARTSRVEGGSLSKCGYRRRPAHIHNNKCKNVYILMVSVPKVAFWSDIGSS
eukprot:9070193-Pyramimonas_sp.AAC.1